VAKNPNQETAGQNVMAVQLGTLFKNSADAYLAIVIFWQLWHKSDCPWLRVMLDMDILVRA
jgi:hypothetical protein